MADRVAENPLRLRRARGAHDEWVENPKDLEAAIIRVLANTPAVIDVVPPQNALSWDAEKGLGFGPDDQALTAWDDAERRRRGEI